MANNFKREEGAGKSIIHVVSCLVCERGEVWLECNSRVTVSKWEAREGNVASKVKVPITPTIFFRLIKSSY